MMDAQATLAKGSLEENENGRIQVIVQDCGLIHTCKVVKAKMREWEAQGLYIFFLAKYCSQTLLAQESNNSYPIHWG